MLPMQVAHLLTLSAITSPAFAGVVTFAIPSSAPPGSGVLDATPVALSFEFPSFPHYFNLTNTWNCIGNLQKVAGIWPAIRTGGTPQDEATYVPDLAVPIEYHEISFSVIPSNFSRKYLEVAASYPGQVTIGLNRGANNITNTIEAATDAVRIVDNLYALELGNEPDTFPFFGFPVAPANFSEWTPAAEAASEAEWQIAVGSAINRTTIIQAGNLYIPPPTFGAAMLLANEDPTALPYIRSFSHHNYPQSVVSSNATSPPNLPALMSHANVAKNVEPYIADAAAAVEAGYPYVLGETNSISGGGDPTISPTFGAALWTLDYALQTASINVSRTYFHQGTINGSNYVWWTPDGVRSPYYGAYAATTALAGGRFLVRLDSGADNYAGYAVFGPDGKPLRATLVNSDYFDGNSTRLEQTFSLTGLECRFVQVRRLTATSSLDRQDEGQIPSFAGRTFLDEGCTANGEEMVEIVEVIDGVAKVTLLASEAVIVDLQA